MTVSDSNGITGTSYQLLKSVDGDTVPPKLFIQYLTFPAIQLMTRLDENRGLSIRDVHNLTRLASLLSDLIIEISSRTIFLLASRNFVRLPDFCGQLNFKVPSQMPLLFTFGLVHTLQYLGNAMQSSPYYQVSLPSLRKRSPKR